MAANNDRLTHPQAMLHRLGAAVHHQQAGRWAAAEAACLEALRLAPEHPDALNLLAGVLLRTQRADEALAVLQRAAQAAPQSAPVHANLARAAFQCGVPELARIAAARAVECDPARSSNWSLLGSAMKELDRLDEAIGAFERAVQLAPQDIEPAFNLAICEGLAGRPAASAARLEALAARAPNVAEVWQALANAHAANGQVDAALPAYRKALALQPSLTSAAVNLGVTLLEAGRVPEADTTLRRALASAPGDTAVLAAVGVLATRTGADDARTLFAFDPLLDAGPFGHPASFASDIDFHAALEQDVLAHPTLAADPANKTTRNGRQSSNLATVQDGALGAFVAHLREHLPRRLDALDAAYRTLGHPAAGSRPARWRLNLWSTVLHRGGHQEPHLHPSGWLSGVFYLRSPAAPDGPAGWIEFGPAPAALAGDAVQPSRLLPPTQGMLLTFPSYLYHRTVPHAEDGLRISLAFDVTPA